MRCWVKAVAQSWREILLDQWLTGWIVAEKQTLNRHCTALLFLLLVYESNLVSQWDREVLDFHVLESRIIIISFAVLQLLGTYQTWQDKWTAIVTRSSLQKNSHTITYIVVQNSYAYCTSLTSQVISHPWWIHGSCGSGFSHDPSLHSSRQSLNYKQHDRES